MNTLFRGAVPRTTPTAELRALAPVVVGLDRWLEGIAAAQRAAPQSSGGYPPHDIEALDEDRFRVLLAVAGVEPERLDVTVEDRRLTVKGSPAEGDTITPGARSVHRGIARRAFERSFLLADDMQVEGAELAHGILRIDMRRVVPEAKRPRRIAVTSAAPPPTAAAAA